MMDKPCTYMPWKLDGRFWFVFFNHWENDFQNNSSGPCLAVIDDFGNLVPTHYQSLA